jgi:hypothetical protein
MGLRICFFVLLNLLQMTSSPGRETAGEISHARGNNKSVLTPQ